MSIQSIRHRSRDKFIVEFDAKGVSVEDLQRKSGNLRSALRSQIESLSEKERDPGIIEVVFSQSVLPQKINYSHVCDLARKAGDFVIGRSKSNLLIQNISHFPHMLVAGTSGYGKSYFLKQMTLNLIENTPNLQVYIFDFKEGVSFKLFKKLPNIKVYTDILQSNSILDSLKAEMTTRLKLTATQDEETIDLKKHSKDPILIIIDECSMLFSPSKTDSIKRDISIKATEVVDEIAKLGRAARFNLVLGNQKILKQTIDTRIQENLLGRICFKVPSISGSNMVLNNKSAAYLPNIKGRAIYNFNEINEEVQTPCLDTNELKSRIDKIYSEFKNQKRNLRSAMLGHKILKNKAQLRDLK